MHLIEYFERDAFVQEVAVAQKAYLLEKRQGTRQLPNLQIPDENMQGSEIQGLRTTGTGRGSRSIIDRQSKRQLLESDPIYREM